MILLIMWAKGDVMRAPLMNSGTIAKVCKMRRGIMKKRREFLKLFMGFFGGSYLLFGPFCSALRWVQAGVQRTILPKGTRRETLVNRDPKSLDTKDLETTPLKDFETMGTSDHEMKLSEWRLEVDGRVKQPLRLTYEEILELPAIEKNILMICPGFFANHGRWKGVSMKGLIERAGVEKDVRHVSFRGPRGPREKVESFPIEDVLTDKVFLAYEVNGETLPKRHGFPVRVVAEDYYGDDWVKYVYKLTIEQH
jgi:sulfoxide reductase catalytic subunit YedY